MLFKAYMCCPRLRRFVGTHLVKRPPHELAVLIVHLPCLLEGVTLHSHLSHQRQYGQLPPRAHLQMLHVLCGLGREPRLSRL